MVLDIADAPVRLVRKVPLNVWFRLRRAVENTSTILLVLSQESNAKTCASLVLRVEREATKWSGPPHIGSTIPPMPGCLLKGATHTAEIVRTLLKYKRPRPIDRLHFADSSETNVRFSLHRDPFAAQKLRLESVLPPQPRQEERMQNPG